MKKANSTEKLEAQLKTNNKAKQDYEELEIVNTHNKSLLLITLWKIGIPKWVRKTIWPLAIGN